MRKLRSYVLMLLAAVVLAATGCERRPMEADYVPTVRVIVKCDWQYFCEEPTGMTMYFFRDGEDTPRVISTSQVNDVAVNLPAGHWRMFLINQSVYEFSSYEFFSMNKYAQAFVRLAEIKSNWYVPSKIKSISKETFIGHDPEHLAVALASEFDITHEMVDHYQSAYYEYKTRLKSKAPDSELDYYLSAMDEYTYVIPVTARDIISTVRARIYINNIRSLRSVRAALTGMAQNFVLTKDRTDEGDVDQLLESWVVEFDEEVPTRGYIDYLYYFSCFSYWMPDLNFGPAAECENNACFKDLAASADKWINMGVNGFRLDAVKHIYGGIAGWDNASNMTFLESWYNHCNATYTARKGSKGNFFMVGEVFNEYNDSYAPYSTYLNSLPSVFNFSFWWRLSEALNNQNGSNFVSKVLAQEKIYTSSRSDGIASLKLSNHDEDRTGEVLGKSTAKEKQAGAILLTAQGKPFIYQGEELGYYGSKAGGDEYVRTPINWDGGAWASAKLSGKIISDLKGSAYSVASQSADQNSILNVYRTFGKARAKYPALKHGVMSACSGLANNFAAWYMSDSDGNKMLVVHNLSSSEATAKLSGDLSKIVAQLGSVSVNGNSVTFGGNSSAVFKQY
jgi:hypothetical protein